MLDFLLENQIDWRIAYLEKDATRRVDLWEEIESLRSTTPFVDQIETTNACPFTCKLCPRGSGLMTRSIHHMDFELFKNLSLQIESHFQVRIGTMYDEKNFEEKYLRESIEMFGLRLHHFGSPLSDPDFIRRCVWLKNNCSFPVHASISAEQLSQDSAYRLVESEIDRILIALDGIDEETYSTARGKYATYEKACNGILRLLDAKKRLKTETLIDVQLIDFGQNRSDIEYFQKKWSDVGATVLIKPVFPYPDIKFKGRISEIWSDPCIWPFLGMVIAVDGLVLSCCSDYNSENVIGDSTKQSLQEIWDGDTFRKFREKFFFNRMNTNSLCKRCGFYEYC
jgi:radical SAM protein with 4Fe4S-binding SPASM domain